MHVNCPHCQGKLALPDRREPADLYPDNKGAEVWNHCLDAVARSVAQDSAKPDSAAQELLDQICRLLGIGESARQPAVILTSLGNMKRRAEILGAIESEYFTVRVPADDPELGDEDGMTEECLLNWGHDREAYLDQFGEALQLKLAGIAELNNQRDDQAWREYSTRPIDFPDGFAREHSALQHAFHAGIRHGRESRWRLLAPATVGPTTFREGVSAVLVVEAAQRYHDYLQSPEGQKLEEERKERFRAFLREIHAPWDGKEQQS